MRDRLIKFIATGFGAGLMPVVPGLAGSLVGLAWWWFARDYPWVIPVGIVFAVWCSHVAAKQFGHTDPPSVVIDEICVVPLALLALTRRWELITAFVLFRIFDVWKPWPIRQIQRLPGGLGIVIDDVLAAGYACALTHAIVIIAER